MSVMPSMTEATVAAPPLTSLIPLDDPHRAYCQLLTALAVIA
jgi:hypothetical protein